PSSNPRFLPVRTGPLGASQYIITNLGTGAASGPIEGRNYQLPMKRASVDPSGFGELLILTRRLRTDEVFLVRRETLERKFGCGLRVRHDRGGVYGRVSPSTLERPETHIGAELADRGGAVFNFLPFSAGVSRWRDEPKIIPSAGDMQLR